ncbi:MAG: DUF1697 domain-containing protein [Thermomicrobiales bacterium]|jgi:uncharacterized protein (DUF1697 family)
MSGLPFVAFYRNMNLGHRGSPSRLQLEAAIERAGGKGARSFQTNGTVGFIASAGAANQVVAEAGKQLANEVGYNDAVFVRSLDSVAEILEGNRFGGFADDRTYRETVTFFDGGKKLNLELPWTCPKGNVDIIELHEAFALSVIRKSGSTVGNPTSELEPRLGVPATTRTLGTIERLVKTIG